jgi:hypothetical protein
MLPDDSHRARDHAIDILKSGLTGTLRPLGARTAGRAGRERPRDGRRILALVRKLHIDGY